MAVAGTGAYGIGSGSGGSGRLVQVARRPLFSRCLFVCFFNSDVG